MFEQRISKLLEILHNGYSVFYTGFYTNKSEFLNDCKKYLNNHPGKYDDIKLLIDTYCAANLENVFFIDFMSNRHENKYATKLQMILKEYKTNKESAYKIANNLYTKKSAYKAAITKFKNKYINASVFMKDLEEIENHIIDNVKNKPGMYVNHPIVTVNDDYIEKVYESKMSLTDYAHCNLIDYREYNESIYNKDDYRAKEIKSRTVKCMPVIIDILNKITNNELSYIEYFKLTKLNPYVIKLIANNLNMGNKNISLFVSKYTKTNYNLKKEIELEAKRCINGIEVTKDMVESAFEYLEINQIPLTTITFNEILNEIVKKRTLIKK